MRKFLKGLVFLLISIVGSFIALFMMVLFLGASFGGNTYASMEKLKFELKNPVKLKDSTVLVLKLNGQIVESHFEDPIQEKIENITNIGGNSSKKIGLFQLLESIHLAKKDDKIKAIFINTGNINASMAAIDELRQALLSFKAAGKPVYAYADYYTQKGYYLSSVANKVYMNPRGNLQFNGLSMTRVFMKGTLDKLGVQPKIFKVGHFKSAVEPLIRKSMSDSSRLQTEKLLGSVFHKMIADIANTRGIEKDALKEINETLQVRSSKNALELNLLDDTLYYHQVIDQLKESFASGAKNKVNTMGMLTYQSRLNNQFNGEDKVAIVFAEGEIVDKGNPKEQIVGNHLAGQIRKAAEDSTVKAIVLRINSPGGSALASEVIWAEIMKAKESKPVVASMSGLAASGGYYIATACNEIIADEATITGSIGVFGVLANFEKFLKDKLGVTTDRVSTSKYADFPSFTREMRKDEEEIIQKEVENIYGVFVKRVADGRNLSQEQVRKIAEGRVWSGKDALTISLVDTLGNLYTAINRAKSLSKADSNCVIRAYPQNKTIVDYIVDALEGKDQEEEEGMSLDLRLKTGIPEIKMIQKYLHSFENNHYVRASLPYRVEIE